jgi:hypothetical protein
MGGHPGYLADFDSATGMLHALAASLRGEGLPLLGAMKPAPRGHEVYIHHGPVIRAPPFPFSSVSSQYVIPISPYSAVAVARCFWACSGVPARR